MDFKKGGNLKAYNQKKHRLQVISGHMQIYQREGRALILEHITFWAILKSQRKKRVFSCKFVNLNTN